MGQPDTTPAPRRAFGWLKDAAIITAITLVFTLLLGEAAIRFRDAFFAPPLPLCIEPNEKYGWTARRNYQEDTMKPDAAGVLRRVEIVTDENGFRQFGDPASKKCKVFFIGDSNTFAKDVSQGEPYYAHLMRDLDLEAFAFGTDGYNNMQHYLVLDEWFDRIQPDLVVLQLCHNDLVGNHPGLTRRSRLDQIQIRQPYMQLDGEIRYLNPGDGTWSTYANALPSSFLKYVARQVDNYYLFPPELPPIQAEIEAAGPAHPLFAESVAVTNLIYQRFKQRCGTVPVAAFDIATKQPFHDAFKELCARNGIAFYPAVAEAIAAAKASGQVVHSSDRAHWNPLGHEIAARTLRPLLQPYCAAK